MNYRHLYRYNVIQGPSVQAYINRLYWFVFVRFI